MQNQNGTRWHRRKDARPDEILAAAQILFIEHGYKATKLEDIARAAGVTKGTPYLYFENKAEILKAVVRNGLLANITRLEAAAENGAGPVAAQMRLLMQRWNEDVQASQSSGLVKLMVAEACNFPDLARFYYDEVILRARALLRTLLTRGMASGEFRADLDLDETVQIVLAPLVMALLWEHSFARFEAEPIDMVRHIDHIHDLLTRGLCSRG